MLLTQIGCLRHLEALHLGLCCAVKKADLSFHVAVAIVFDRFEHCINRHQHLAAIGAKAIQRAAFDQAFERTAVKITSAAAAAKIVEIGKFTIVLPLAHDAVDQRVPDSLDGTKPKQDIVSLRGKLGSAVVDIGRQQTDAHAGTFGNIACSLVRGIDHAGQQRRHIIDRIMAFQISGTVRDRGIGSGM